VNHNPTLSRVSLAAVAVAVSLALAGGTGCASRDGQQDEGVSGSKADELVSGLKPGLKGLVWTSGKVPTDAEWSFIKSSVYKIDWADIELTNGNYDFSGIDGAVAAAHARGGALRLRIMAGEGAPQFVKAIGGLHMSDPTHGIDCSAGGVAVYNAWDKKGSCVPPFWLTRVIDQYEQLMTAVAARYDNVAEIRDVVDSACMTTYAEPFFRAHAEPGTNARLYAAGLTLDKDRACHTRAIAIHAHAFVHTRTSLAINAWDVIDGSADHWTPSTTATLDFVNQVAIPALGKRLVLQNNSLNDTDTCPASGGALTNYPYCFMKTYAGESGYQTETFARLGATGSDPSVPFSVNEGGLYQALANGVGLGASFVEFSGLGSTILVQLDSTKLRSYDTQLRAN
jgi:hypothetical protein